MRPRRWTDEQLIQAVAEEQTIADVCRRLGLQVCGGVYRHLRFHIERLKLDTSHMAGSGWARNKNLPGSRSLPLSQVLVEFSPIFRSSSVRRRLIAAGIKPSHCEDCGLSEWRGQPLPLELTM